jgi:hypothetical protein
LFKSNRNLIVGDILAILIVTIIGFTAHGETGAAFLPRMAVIFLPLAIGWFILAPWFGLFQPEITSNLNRFGRPALAMLFAAPFAVILRGLILNAPIIPIFAVALSGTSAFGMLIWRTLYFFLNRIICGER